MSSTPGRPWRRRRPPFRTQKAGSILLHAAQAALFPQPRVVVRSGSGTNQDPTEEGVAAFPRTPETSRASMSLYAPLATLLIVIAISIGVLVHVLSPASSQSTGTSPTSASSGNAGGTSQPATKPLVPASGQPVPAVRTIDGAHGGTTFLQPQESVVGHDGMLYVADTGNRRVVELDPSGRLVRAITVGARGPLLAPFGLALTPRGQLLVLDSDAGRILEYDPNGRLAAASDPSLSLVHARGIAVDPATGDVLVANTPGNAVLTLGPNFALLHVQPNRVGGVDLFEQPSVIAVGKDGTIDVLDSQNNRVVQFGRNWNVLHTWPIVGSDTLHSPHLLPLSGGRVLATDPTGGNLLLYSPGDAQPVVYVLPVAGTGLLPLGVASTPSGAVLITCNNANQLLEVRVPGL